MIRAGQGFPWALGAPGGRCSLEAPMQLFLAILFVVNGEVVTGQGYAPRAQPDLATCLERLGFAHDYLSGLPGHPPIYAIGCMPAATPEAALARLYGQGAGTL
jgi:hypothetical protein